MVSHKLSYIIRSHFPFLGDKYLMTMISENTLKNILHQLKDVAAIYRRDSKLGKNNEKSHIGLERDQTKNSLNEEVVSKKDFSDVSIDRVHSALARLLRRSSLSGPNGMHWKKEVGKNGPHGMHWKKEIEQNSFDSEIKGPNGMHWRKEIERDGPHGMHWKRDNGGNGVNSEIGPNGMHWKKEIGRNGVDSENNENGKEYTGPQGIHWRRENGPPGLYWKKEEGPEGVHWKRSQGPHGIHWRRENGPHGMHWRRESDSKDYGNREYTKDTSDKEENAAPYAYDTEWERSLKGPMGIPWDREIIIEAKRDNGGERIGKEWGGAESSDAVSHKNVDDDLMTKKREVDSRMSLSKVDDYARP